MACPNGSSTAGSPISAATGWPACAKMAAALLPASFVEVACFRPLRGMLRRISIGLCRFFLVEPSARIFTAAPLHKDGPR